jgi:hypothetical protein
MSIHLHSMILGHVAFSLFTKCVRLIDILCVIIAHSHITIKNLKSSAAEKCTAKYHSVVTCTMKEYYFIVYNFLKKTVRMGITRQKNKSEDNFSIKQDMQTEQVGINPNLYLRGACF